ncbi:hypothetical protein NLG97_g10929 [Lecanicillium saksenae]|uniref:Uncharacterized protein n=1 Tax=Lecanicillium saksenae TaxID=468837 RepID=A0ACC1QC10_9HYPO|nr:hypothetical protein NLG97_g10929 [Lecanicillium saksenae]
MGAQRAVHYAPGRWIVIAEVLDTVRRCVPMVQARWPDAVEVHPGHDGCFPRTRILRQDAMAVLQTLVAASVCERGITGFPIAQQSKEVRSAVRCYITQPQLTEEQRASVEVRSGFVTEETKDTLLLLRGLLAQGILSFVLEKKRWRVDYGLDPSRPRPTRLAVPFRAKDLPTDRSEFSHPDVVIALTSLCYYYTGLSDDDLMLSIRHLQQSDQADMEYQDWVKDAFNLPSSLQQLVSVNLDDRHKCTTELFRCFRHAKSAVDYFLAHMVFPKEMKEFPHKLSASGWDIAATRHNPTTGFSGTNDSRIVLPLSVQQIDLGEQAHTNALVLAYLLQPENSALPMLHAPGGTLSDAERLLATVVAMDPPARVILDVGAQILELDNIGVAQAWLSMLSGEETTQAAIFVDKDDHICVLDRKGYVEPLHTSPFATQLDACVVFLDEAHTRGIDLALPHYYRAAVTLGANLTKDRLVQGETTPIVMRKASTDQDTACMRMRRLGHGQSVVFCVPREICAKLQTDRPTVAEILQWAIRGTWTDAARSVPLWAVQGRRHHAQSAVWTAAQTAEGTLQMTKPQAREFLEQEAASMESRYAPRVHAAAACDDEEEEDDAISQRFCAFKPMDQFAATLSEEQERELSPEIEQEREVQRAAPEKPARHALHPDMVAYVATGRMAADSSARLPPLGRCPPRAQRGTLTSTPARVMSTGAVDPGEPAAVPSVRRRRRDGD